MASMVIPNRRQAGRRHDFGAKTKPAKGASTLPPEGRGPAVAARRNIRAGAGRKL